MSLLTGETECDEVLNWLDAHSVSLTQGAPAHLLRSKWLDSGRPPERLGECLNRLLDDNWLAITPLLEPAHLRLSLEGYRRMLEPRPAPAQQVTPEPQAPAPTIPDVVAQVAEPEAPRAFRPRSAVSEISLRNELLSIYRDLRLKAESRLISVTLTRYWQEMGLRAGDLRTAIGVALRDGYLRQRIDGMDKFWVLTQAGEAYLRRPPVSPVLLALAPPAGDPPRAAVPDDELSRLTAHVILGFGNRAVPYEQVLEVWKRSEYDDNALLHGLDLLDKEGHLLIEGDATATQLRLTEDGTEYGRVAGSGTSRFLAKLSRVLG